MSSEPKPKRAKPIPATKLSTDHLEADGWIVGNVEKWVPHTPIRQDLFGFADLVAVKPGRTPQLIQVTSSSNMAARVSKILASHLAIVCLMGGLEIVVHGWREKTKANPTRSLREQHITLADFARAAPSE